jgi:hypothetical protein
MSVPISEMMTCALSVLMTGIKVSSSTPVRKGRQVGIHLPIDLGDRRVQSGDLLQVQARHKTVMAPDPSG